MKFWVHDTLGTIFFFGVWIPVTWLVCHTVGHRYRMILQDSTVEFDCSRCDKSFKFSVLDFKEMSKAWQSERAGTPQA